MAPTLATKFKSHAPVIFQFGAAANAGAIIAPSINAPAVVPIKIFLILIIFTSFLF
jgi:hypothetical protein